MQWPVQGPIRLSEILMYYNIATAGETDKGEVVAVGTGNMITPTAAVNAEGRTILDCHALTIARRALLKWVPVNCNLPCHVTNFYLTIVYPKVLVNWKKTF